MKLKDLVPALQKDASVVLYKMNKEYLMTTTVEALGREWLLPMGEYTVKNIEIGRDALEKKFRIVLSEEEKDAGGME